MPAYSESYLKEVVENQGKLFDFVSQNYPQKDTADFIEKYMTGRTRKSIDEAQAYVSTMDAAELWEYFCKNDNFSFKEGSALKGFMPNWIGEFYAYYQWYYDIPSSEVIKKVPLDFLIKAYNGLHDLELNLAVKKVGNGNPIPILQWLLIMRLTVDNRSIKTLNCNENKLENIKIIRLTF